MIYSFIKAKICTQNFNTPFFRIDELADIQLIILFKFVDTNL